MEIRDLRTFMAVAGALSFHRAGQALHAAQSTVSVRIQALEEELGVRLFDRLGRRVALTEAGGRLLDYGRRILDLEEEARAWTGAGAGGGSLTVRMPETLCVERLPGVLREFRARFPRVRLRLTPCASDSLAEDLRRGLTDLAFVLALEVMSPDLRAERLGVEELVLAASPGHALARLAEVGPGDLAGETLLATTSDCSYRRVFENGLAREGKAPSVGLECGSLAAVKRFAVEGLGYAVLPVVAARAELAAGTLAPLPWNGGPLEAAVFMVRHKDQWLGPALAAFMELCRQGLGG